VSVKNTREQAFAAPAFVVATINLTIFARVMKNILDMPASETLFVSQMVSKCSEIEQMEHFPNCVKQRVVNTQCAKMASIE
jgi:hypothetical protein